MNYDKLYSFVLLLVAVGMLLGVGILTLDKYSTAVRTTTTVQDDGVNVSSGAATLSQTYCIGLTGITNYSGVAFSASTYNVSYTNTETCAINSDLPVHMLYNVTFTYGASTTAQTAADNVVSAMSPIASQWLPLIVTVFVLAIILTLVIKSFAGKQR